MTVITAIKFSQFGNDAVTLSADPNLELEQVIGLSMSKSAPVLAYWAGLSW